MSDRLFDAYCSDIATNQNSSNNIRITTEHPKISNICPGVKYLMAQKNPNVTLLQINGSVCTYLMRQFTARQGAVYGVCEDLSTFCQLHVKVARGQYVRAHVQRLAYWCGSSFWAVKMGKSLGSCYFSNLMEVGCGYHSLTDIFYDSQTNQLAMLHRNNPLIEVDIKTIKRPSLIVKYVLEHCGYVITPFLHSSTCFEEELKGSPGCAIMVSVQQFKNYFTDNPEQIDLIYREPNSSHPHVKHVCIQHTAPASIFFTSSLLVQFCNKLASHFGLGIYFSTLSEKDHLEKLPSGSFNCSVNHYSKFQDHLHCNLEPECEDGRDETEHCPFSSPGCQGLVASRNKCFLFITMRTESPVPLLAYDCQMKGGNLASMKSRQEQEDSRHIFSKCYYFKFYLGYSSGWVSAPFAYSKFEKWSDDTIIYNINHFQMSDPYHPSRHVQTRQIGSMGLSVQEHFRTLNTQEVLCEVQLQSRTVSSSPVLFSHTRVSLFILTNTWQILTVCPNNHVTHTFLACDLDSHCGKTTYSQFCMIFNVSDEHVIKLNLSEKMIFSTHATFRCDDGVTTVPYTLVCDFRQDCPDTSDESFCERPSCLGFLCSNGQCVSQEQRCNEYSDCLDDSDEIDCPKPYWVSCAYCIQIRHTQAPWVFINLDGTGYFIHQVMEAEESCPDTHYRCTAEWLYCLPVYTRCNGFSDCVYGDDEEDCDIVTFPCPGFYQCRASTVCVHGNHLCDGWGQCPQGDDELMCDRTCPQGCLCHGHSFLCHNRFCAELFPQLRYLDATASGMLLSDFTKNICLFHLSLSKCSLFNISSVKIINLQFIDLANNHLNTLDITVLLKLPNLRKLLLTNNPFVQMTCKMVKDVLYALRLMDLSRSRLRTLNSELSLYLPQLEHLNLSFSGTDTMKPTGFRNMPQLTELDVRGDAFYNFPVGLFSGSKQLSNIFSSNYRFCCENVLPKHVSKIKCFAPNIIFRSCTTLMPTDMHRIFFWCVSASAILGNLLSFIVTSAVKKMFEKSFVRTVVQLELAYVCMGGHVSIVVIANEAFDETYIQIEKMWTSGLTCKVSGFLSILSIEMSIFIKWIITLDHIIILCSPGDSSRFKQCSTAAVCTVTWLVGMLLSLMPFLPGLSHWGLHGQSGLCRLALFHHYNSHQQFRWFTVIVAINFIVCSMVVANQVVIYRRTPAYRIALDPAKRWTYSSVHLMGRLTVTESVSWILFGVVALMAKSGVAVTETIHDAMVVFVLPLSSALNPVLYMWTLASLSRGQAHEHRIVEWLKSRSVVSNNK